MMPMSLSNQQSAQSGATGGSASMPWDASGFSVNFGNGVVQGGATPSIPQMYYVIAAVIGFVLWKKKKFF